MNEGQNSCTINRLPATVRFHVDAADVEWVYRAFIDATCGRGNRARARAAGARADYWVCVVTRGAAFDQRWTPSLKLAADGLLSHLSLLFIPAGVGVVMHLKAIREEGLAIAVALAVSTLVGLAVTAWVAERIGKHERAPERAAARDA